MQRLVKHKVVITVVVILAAAGAGGAYAATQTGSNPRQAFLNDVAKRLHVTPAHLRAAVQGAMLDRLEAAVKAGKLTQAQADRLKQRIEHGGLPFFGPRGRLGRLGFGPRGRLEPLGPPGPFGLAAKYLGLTDRQLLIDMAHGKTLAQVAQGKGKSVSGLEQALAAGVKTRLDRLVSSGFITKAREQRRLSRLNAEIARFVNHGLPRLRPLRGAEVPGPGGAGWAPPIGGPAGLPGVGPIGGGPGVPPGGGAGFPPPGA